MPLRQHLPILREFCLLVLERFRSERCSQVAGLGDALRAFLLANLLPEFASRFSDES